MNKDLEHLRWLSIGHYIGAAVSFLFIGLTLLQFYGVFQDAKDIVNKKGNPSTLDEFGVILFVFAIIYLFVEITRIICTVLVAKFLQQKKNHTFCLVISIINCAFFPIGTVLGVFALVILCRQSVKELFEMKAISNSPLNL